jgi:hypothetical protein
MGRFVKKPVRREDANGAVAAEKIILSSFVFFRIDRQKLATAIGGNQVTRRGAPWIAATMMAYTPQTVGGNAVDLSAVRQRHRRGADV